MVEGTTDRVSYTCMGGKGPYAIPSDMTVSLTARGNATNLKVILVDPDDVENTLTFSTEYTVTGRNVYTVSNYSSSYTLIIARSMPFTQERDLRNQSTLNMEHLETAYDAACMERRELLEQIGRQLVFPISDPAGLNYELPVVSSRASSFLACDASGNVIASSGVSSVPVSTFMEDFLDDTTGADALTTLGVTATPEEVNRVADGVTATAAEVNEVADRSARTKLLSEENYTILDDDGYAVFLVVTGAGITGTATTDTENKLIDSTATFVTDGVVAGDYIHNTTDDTWGVVDSVDSETELTLTTDAFPDGDEDWTWAPVTVVLPTAADNMGREIFVKKLDSDDGVVHIAFEAGEDEVEVSQIVGDGGYIEIISDGTDWYIKDHYDRYSTGWVNRTTWEGVAITITHNLGKYLSDLNVRLFISTDGTEANAFEPVVLNYAGTAVPATGVSLYAVDTDSFTMQTGAAGICFIQSSSGGYGLVDDGDDRYYKVVVYSKQI